ncbi:hypothetical protein ACWEOE_12175 [Amycolatopsis sp. NPDC004368]
MSRRPVGKKRRGLAKFPVVRAAPRDGEPYLPLGRDARPEGAERVLQRMGGRVALYLAAVAVCVGMAIAGVNRFGAIEASSHVVHDDAVTVDADVIGYLAEGTYIHVTYPAPSGSVYDAALGVSRGNFPAPGERVRITYNPDAPNTAWFADDDGWDPLQETIAFGLLFAGMLGWITAVSFAGVWWWRRRVVRRTGWRAAKFDFGEPGVVHAAFTDGTRLRLRPADGLSRRYARFGRGRYRGFLAGTGDNMVLLVPGKKELVLKAVSTRWT